MSRRAKWTAGILLLLAAALRFYRFGELQFLHDELSALQRLQGLDWSALFQQGIRPDGHPPGTQVLLWGWYKVTGFSEFWLKLPFALLSLASLAFLMACGRPLKNAWAGIYAAGILAVTQQHLMYAQLIRPYGLGLFFSTAALYFYLQVTRGKRTWTVLLLLGLAWAGMAYSHHFSALLGALMALTLVLKQARQDKRIWLAPAVALLLYLPNLGIFWQQLSYGGIGTWLGAPKWFFLLHYFHYFFHYSWYFLGAFAILLVWSFYRSKPGNHIFYAGGLWFLISYGIMHAYSLLIDPVLQVSALVFAAPVLLLSLFSLRQQKGQFLPLALVCTAGVLSLYQERQHYPYFYRSPFEYALQELDSLQKTTPDAYLITNLDSGKLSLYQHRYPELWSRWRNGAAPTDSMFQGEKLLLAWTDGHENHWTHQWAEAYGGVQDYRFHFNLSLYYLERKASSVLRPLAQELQARPWTFLKGPGFSRSFQWPAQESGPEDYYLLRWELRPSKILRELEMVLSLHAPNRSEPLEWRSSGRKAFRAGQTQPWLESFVAKSALPRESQLVYWQHQLWWHQAGLLDHRFQGWALYPGNAKRYGLFEDF